MQFPLPRKFAFVFICQRGRLEIESLLLAASLRRWLRGEFELIAAVPTPIELMGEPRQTTQEMLRTLGVRVERVRNEIVAEKQSRDITYLLTNKIFSLRVATTADKLVLLDSDQLCRREFSPTPYLRAPLGARRADFISSRDVGAAWERVFQASGAACPSLWIRVPHPQGDANADVYAPPSFNSSLVAIDATLAADFSRLWEECFRRVDDAGALRAARYYQEQASLAAAACKSGIAYEMLDLHGINSHLAHYFRPQRIGADASLLEIAKSLVRELTGIEELLRDEPEWTFLLS